VVNKARALRSSYRFCAALSRRNARNFFYAFMLLPAPVRRSMCALYAFMRHTDDLADEPDSAARKAEAIASWRLELDAALEGRESCWPGLPALADTITRHGIPVQLLHEVIEGVSMDIEPRRYRAFADLALYCHHVASAVGLCCLHIWGYRSSGGQAERLAEACGIALQLTNIIRDVREDAAGGRIYLPLEDLERFGVAPEELAAAGPPRDSLRALLAFEAERASTYYDLALALAPLISARGRPVFLTIVGTYRDLLGEIVARNYNVLDGRVSLPRWRKAVVVLYALLGRVRLADPGRELDPEYARYSESVVPLK
jgi:15-cis-phytoene synthase